VCGCACVSNTHARTYWAFPCGWKRNGTVSRGGKDLYGYQYDDDAGTGGGGNVAIRDFELGFEIDGAVVSFLLCTRVEVGTGRKKKVKLRRKARKEVIIACAMCRGYQGPARSYGTVI